MNTNPIPDDEVYRYLGYPPGIAPDPLTCSRIGQAKSRIISTAQPRSTTRILHREQVEFLLRGQDIRQHMEGSENCLLMAVTLGSPTDHLLRTASISDMEEALLLDAAASVYVDAAAQQVEDQVRAEQRKKEHHVTLRFSPGYGDFPIEVQGEMLQFLDAGRKIGLFVTSTHILTPRKSITAICGISSHPVTGKLAGCHHCRLQTQCHYKKEGKTCGE